MEECKELIVKNKKFDKIKSFLKKLFDNKIFCLVIFFFFMYISIDLLNNEGYRDSLKPNISIFDRLYYIAFNGYIFLRFPKSICNIFIFIFAYCIIKGLTGKTRMSCFIVALISEIFGIINYIVIQARGVALSISDIYSVQTAINVSDGIKINFDIFFIIAIIIFIMANLFLFKFQTFDDKIKENKLKQRFIKVIVGLIGVVFLFNFKPLMKTVDNWDVNSAYKFSGPGVTVMKLLKNFKVEEPDDYNKEMVEKILNNYNDDFIENKEKKPNVIVVMNESFADLSELFNITLTEESLPYYKELMKEENVVSGVMHSSKFGGGTANVEYEFLTQNTTAFLPNGALPYQQYIMNEVKESLVSNLENLEYESYGIHSWKLSGYSRSKVYKHLQFDNIAFKENMNNLEMDINGYSTDSSSYEYWYEIMKNKPQNEKNFTFLVTVQNHFPYEEVDENDTQYSKEDEQLNSYMQFLNKSDDALKELIEFIKDYEEDTILLFFGDHQPNLGLEEEYGLTGLYPEEEVNYIVPFFIWANYDIEEKKGIEISTNYLQSVLLETIDMPLDKYTKYIIELRKTIPVITSHYYIAKDGNRYMIDDEDSPYYEKIKEYWNVIYYQMFDNI